MSPWGPRWTRALGWACVLCMASFGATRAHGADSPRDEVGAALLWSALPASVGRGTVVTAWPGLRVARHWLLGPGLKAGLDLGAYAHALETGTSRVAMAPALFGLDARARLEAFWAAGLWEAGLSLYAGPFVAGGVLQSRVDDERSYRWLGTHAFRLGGGIAMQVGQLTTRFDTGGGLRDGAPEVHAGLACAWTW